MVNILDKKAIEKTAESEYESLLRALRRRKGFGLLFVESTPVGGLELIAKVKRDLPQKKIDVLNLDNSISNLIKKVKEIKEFPNQDQLNILFIDILSSEDPSNNLIEKVKEFPNQDQLNILFITGLEKLLVKYVRPGYGGKGDYYNLDSVPQILSHLNWQRENFRDQFRHLCFVFILPKYAIKYISLRAPDFFDWSSGVFVFPDDQKVSIPSVNPRTSRLLEWLGYGLLVVTTIILLQSDLPWPIISLLSLCFSIFFGFKAWNLESMLDEFDRNNARNNAVIAAYVNALKIKPDDHYAWYNRGAALANLGRYEEAISSYDHALKIKPDDHDAWDNRGYALGNLGRYEEAISSYDNALKIKPDFHQAWYNRGIALRKLGRYEEAISSYDNALKTKPSFHKAWYGRGYALGNLGRYEEAITSFDQTLKFKSDDYEAWIFRGYALGELGRYEEAIASYDNALKIKPDYARVYFNKACAYGLQENISLAIENLTQAINLDSKCLEMAKTDTDFDKIRNDSRFIELINQSDYP